VPDLHEIFFQGQIVRVQVLSLPDEGKKLKKIDLSMNPKKVNRSLKVADIEPGLVSSYYFSALSSSSFHLLRRRGRKNDPILLFSVCFLLFVDTRGICAKCC
jgi:hypothetical protein